MELLKIKEIGLGSVGSVWKAQDLKTKEEVAIKFIKRGKNVKKYVIV